jgi:excisionase family DNA binding protein
MTTATAKARDLSKRPTGNTVSTRFPPILENRRTFIPEADLPSREVFELGVRSINADPERHERDSAQPTLEGDRLLNARQVADKLGVSERFIRDHTTRRSPRIPAVKLGKLIRYRRADVDVFMAQLGTLPTSRRSQFGV